MPPTATNEAAPEARERHDVKARVGRTEMAHPQNMATTY